MPKRRHTFQSVATDREFWRDLGQLAFLATSGIVATVAIVAYWWLAAAVWAL